MCRFLSVHHFVSSFSPYIYRDIKPENILLKSIDDDTSIKLADFGFAAKEGDPYAKQPVGTPGYLAPEIIRRLPHGKLALCNRSF